MAKREKFIVIMAVLAVVGYVGSMLLSGGETKRRATTTAAHQASPEPDSDAAIAEIQKSIDDSQKTVSSAKPEELAVYVVANSEAPFPQDPFYFRVQVPEQEQETLVEEAPVPSVELVYTGFIQVGRTRMAIINNLEYVVGDDVAGTGFLLQSIRSDRVEIVSREGKYSSQIPFVEEGL